MALQLISVSIEHLVLTSGLASKCTIDRLWRQLVRGVEGAGPKRMKLRLYDHQP